MSLKIYPKTFINPLVALAFKEGIDFVGDPDYNALEPKKEGDKWVVLIEHTDDDDDDESNDEIVHSTVKHTQQKISTLRDFEDRFKHMKPIAAKSAPGIVHLPIKSMKPCGECLPCSQGQDCLQIINTTLAAMAERAE